MPCCEKCWRDSYAISLLRGCSQTEAYCELLEQRRDSPCSPKEQAGEYWDEERQCDKRLEEVEK